MDYQPRTRIVFGANKIDQLGTIARDIGAQRALVVSDPGVIAAGHTQRGIDSLQAAGVQSLLYDAVRENPSTADVEQGTQFARDCRPDLLIGLGGGSSMDCAKGINFIFSNGGRMQDYWGVGKAQQAMLPMIAVPTTAGTGSEAQSFALISDAETHVKMACGDKKAACRVAVLDPQLTLSQPPHVTALTGIDAIAHALETYVTKKRNPMSIAFSREAWRLLAGSFARVLDDPADLESRSAMQLGACFAGMAIENSMLGATHALANPLTAHYGIIHGQAIAVMLPHVIRYNALQCPQWYNELALPAISPRIEATCCSGGAEGLAEFARALAGKAGLAGTLSECGVREEELPTLAADAAKQWTGTFNPRPVSQPDLEGLYRQAF
jgi:alcohol dehydrogenase